MAQIEKTLQKKSSQMEPNTNALQIAKKNHRKLAPYKEIEFIEAGLEKVIETYTENESALILANLPYVSNKESLPNSVYSWEPHCALFAGERGAELIEELINVITKKPPKYAQLIVEHGCNQGAEIQTYLAENAWTEIYTDKDLQNHDRFTVSVCKSNISEN